MQNLYGRSAPEYRVLQAGLFNGDAYYLCSQDDRSKNAINHAGVHCTAVVKVSDLQITFLVTMYVVSERNGIYSYIVFRLGFLEHREKFRSSTVFITRSMTVTD